MYISESQMSQCLSQDTPEVMSVILLQLQQQQLNIISMLLRPKSYLFDYDFNEHFFSAPQLYFTFFFPSESSTNQPYVHMPSILNAPVTIEDSDIKVFCCSYLSCCSSEYYEPSTGYMKVILQLAQVWEEYHCVLVFTCQSTLRQFGI